MFAPLILFITVKLLRNFLYCIKHYVNKGDLTNYISSSLTMELYFLLKISEVKTSFHTCETTVFLLGEKSEKQEIPDALHVILLPSR